MPAKCTSIDATYGTDFIHSKKKRSYGTDFSEMPGHVNCIKCFICSSFFTFLVLLCSVNVTISVFSEFPLATAYQTLITTLSIAIVLDQCLCCISVHR
jgi:hypothetical protein